MIARCLVRQKTSKNFIFDYLIPEKLKDIKPLTLIEVPFGRKKIQAIIYEVLDREVKKEKTIIRALSNGPVFTNIQLELAQSISYEFLCNLPQTIFSFLPSLNKKDLIGLGTNNKIKPSRQSKKFFIEGLRPDRINFYFQKIDKTRQNLLILPGISQVESTRLKLKKLDPSRQTFVWHSLLSSKEKTKVWKMLSSGEPCLIIATRHGLFLPFTRLQNIFLDQHTSFSYFEDQQPAYNASKAVRIISSIYKCNVFFGDSLPSAEILVGILTKKVEKITLPSSIKVRRLTSFETIFSSSEFSQDYKLSRKILVTGFFKEITYLYCTSCNIRIKCPGCQKEIFDDKNALCVKCLRAPGFVCPTCQNSKIEKSQLSLSKIYQVIEQTFDQKASSNEQEKNKIIVKSLSDIESVNPVFDLAIIPYFDLFASFPFLNFRFNLIRSIKELPSLGAKKIYILTRDDSDLSHDISRLKFEKILSEELNSRKAEKLPPFTRFITLSGPENLISELSKVLNSDFTKINDENFIGFLSHPQVKKLQSYWQKNNPQVKARLDSPDF